MTLSALPTKLGAVVDAWIAADPDPSTRAELAAMVAAGDNETIAGLFQARLAFGTAGLRAALGPGPMRMNELVVAQATAGLMDVLADNDGSPTVVIGHDARHGSVAFANAAAEVAGRMGRAVLLPPYVPTPLLAYAVRYVRADAGVMVTASHNPPADNGYKVYLDHGAQITPPLDADIAEAIGRAGDSWNEHRARRPAGRHGGRSNIGSADPGLLDSYLTAITSLLRYPDRRSVTVVYTAMHGVAAATFRSAFERGGFRPPIEVATQAEPDPDFPTVTFPNPEEPGALDLALELASASNADVVLANDPDGDRLGVAIPTSQGWRGLRGDEIGVLLADHLLRSDRGDDRLVVTTVVSSRMLGSIAASHGVQYEETLTGFKWIAEAARRRSDLRFVLGYEEALGYAVGDVVADKDGISAALLFAELVADLLAAGSSVEARLEELAREHGVHLTRQVSVRFDDRTTGAERQRQLMDGLRESAPASFGGVEVERLTDLLTGGDDALPPTNALRFDLVDGTRIMVRPSGTEPKVKYYLEVIEPVDDRGYAASVERSTVRLDRIAADLTG